MSEELEEIAEETSSALETSPEESPQEDRREKTNWLEALARLGLGDALLRFASGALTLLALAAIVVLLRMFFTGTPQNVEAQPLDTEADPGLVSPQSIPQAENVYRGIGRVAGMENTTPNHP
jgi:hypothetical protein